jgi:hypothetical protein
MHNIYTVDVWANHNFFSRLLFVGYRSIIKEYENE